MHQDTFSRINSITRKHMADIYPLINNVKRSYAFELYDNEIFIYE